MSDDRVHQSGFLLVYEDDEGRLLVHVGGPQLIQPMKPDDVEALVRDLDEWLDQKGKL
jgi:hypothetical protein